MPRVPAPLLTDGSQVRVLPGEPSFPHRPLVAKARSTGAPQVLSRRFASNIRSTTPRAMERIPLVASSHSPRIWPRIPAPSGSTSPSRHPEGAHAVHPRVRAPKEDQAERARPVQHDRQHAEQDRCDTPHDQHPRPCAPHVPVRCGAVGVTGPPLPRRPPVARLGCALARSHQPLLSSGDRLGKRRDALRDAAVDSGHALTRSVSRAPSPRRSSQCMRRECREADGRATRSATRAEACRRDTMSRFDSSCRAPLPCRAPVVFCFEELRALGSDHSLMPADAFTQERSHR